MFGGRRIAIALVGCFAALFSVIAARAAVLPSSQDLLSMVPGAASFEHEISPTDFYRMKDASGRVIGAAFVTSNIPPQVSGYGGELDVLVGIDPSGAITGIKILSHNETPQIMQKLLGSGFLSRFTGHKAGDNFADIEAVSGATISSQAIVDDIKTSAAAVAAALAGKGGEAGGYVSARTLPWLHAGAAIIMIGLCIASVLRPSVKKLRAIALVFSVIVIGLWLNTPITIGDIVDVRNFAVSWAAKLPLAILMAFALAASFWRGNLYCSYICPFGALQQGAAELMPAKCRPSDRMQRSLGWLRWFVAIATIYAIAGMGSYAFREIEPFALCFSRDPDLTTIIQTATVLAAALFVRRIWCRFFCPTGLVLDLIGQLGCKARHAALKFARRRHGPCPAP